MDALLMKRMKENRRLKKMYAEEIARAELENFSQTWDEKYPQISRS